MPEFLLMQLTLQIGYIIPQPLIFPLKIPESSVCSFFCMPDIHSQRTELLPQFLRDAGRASAGGSGSPPHDGKRARKHNVLDFVGEMQNDT
jgi:hypothetical protein